MCEPSRTLSEPLLPSVSVASCSGICGLGHTGRANEGVTAERQMKVWVGGERITIKVESRSPSYCKCTRVRAVVPAEAGL